MAVTKANMLTQIEKLPSTLRERLVKHARSPLNYAFDALRANTDANDIDHSFRVAKYCKAIANKTGLNLSQSDRLVLFYASLLHDISKSSDTTIIADIEKILCRRKLLFSDQNCDHGVRSAHYVEQRQKDRLKFFGLNKDEVKLMCNIIAFHSVAILHSPFRANKVCRNDILLCLLFWVADVSDGVCDRVVAPATVRKGNRTAKVEAREQIEKTIIRKDQILWVVREGNKEVEKAAKLANEELSKHKLLLQAFGLPSEILITKKAKNPSCRATLSNEDLGRCGLSLDLKDRKCPLQISTNTLYEAYESIVEAFQKKVVKGQPRFKHYFGPLLVEIRNIDQDEAEKITVRNNHKLNIDNIQTYAKFWLDDGPDAAKRFYFGYTHGQRIHKYMYSKIPNDLKNENFYTWTGKREQLKSVEKILGEDKENARRAYAVIAHPIIDNSINTDRFHNENIVQPALIAIHFRIETNNRLSAFAFLRSQEMSTFFLVNYFELKKLVEQIAAKLSLEHGRIIMTTSLAYFDEDTTLFDMPEICRLDELSIGDFGQNIEDMGKREALMGMLREVASRTFMKTEYEWCSTLKTSLSHAAVYKPLKQAIGEMEGALRRISEYSGSPIPKNMIDQKQKTVKEVNNLLETWNND